MKYNIDAGALRGRIWQLALFAGVLLLGSLDAGASTVTVNFETLPALSTQPNNFAAAGPEQTYTAPGVFTISGGVALGNPTFLASFPAHGSAPNLYGTTDIADPSLLDTIRLTLPNAAATTSVTGVLFNGQPISETYQVNFFSGTLLLSAQPFIDVQDSSNVAGFRNFAFSSTSANPITLVTVTTPNAGVNGYDFFVDSLVLTQGATTVPEPASILLLSIGVAGLGSAAWMRRRPAGSALRRRSLETFSSQSRLKASDGS